jgi:hypothetical protein
MSVPDDQVTLPDGQTIKLHIDTAKGGEINFPPGRSQRRRLPSRYRLRWRRSPNRYPKAGAHYSAGRRAAA